MRCFLAIALPDDIQQAIVALQTQLQAELNSTGLRASWVSAGNFHITLKFLGDINDEQIIRLSQILDRTTLVAPFKANLHGLDWFPSAKRPRICVLNVANGADALRDLSAKVEAEFAPLGFAAAAHPFHPHVTLARLKISQTNPATAWSPRDQAVAIGPFACTEVVLVKSTLTTAGSQYTTLARWQLH
jgi:2'-5' RNA ligase